MDNDRLAPVSRWHRVVLIAVIVYVLISTSTWFGLTWELNNLLDTFTAEHQNQKDQREQAESESSKKEDSR